jgi:hypothetical protein
VHQARAPWRAFDDFNFGIVDMLGHLSEVAILRFLLFAFMKAFQDRRLGICAASSASRCARSA